MHLYREKHSLTTHVQDANVINFPSRKMKNAWMKQAMAHIREEKKQKEKKKVTRKDHWHSTECL